MAKPVTAQTAGFKIPTERANVAMRDTATATGTYQFLQITTHQMFGTEASRIAALGIIPVESGIKFNHLGYVVEDADLEKLLRLTGQRTGWRPEANAPPLTRAMAEFMGCCGHFDRLRPEDVISQSINHKMLDRASTQKAWIIRMQEHLFLRKSPSSVSASALQILYQICKAPWKTFGYCKTALSLRREEPIGSLPNLMLAYLLRNSSYGTEEDRARLGENGSSMIVQSIAEVSTPGRSRAELEAAAPWQGGDEEDEESEQQGTGGAEVVELSSDDGGVEGYTPQFGATLIEKMDGLKISSQATHLLLTESRTAIRMGMKEIARLNEELQKWPRKREKMRARIQKLREDRDDQEYKRGTTESQLHKVTEELSELQHSYKEIKDREEAFDTRKDQRIKELELTTAKLRTANKEHLDKMQAGAAELSKVLDRETQLNNQMGNLRLELKRSETERASAEQRLEEMRAEREAEQTEKEKTKGELAASTLGISTSELQLQETTQEPTRILGELQQKEEEMRLSAQAEERMLTEKATNDAQYCKSQGEIAEQLTTTPEERRALSASGKKRKTGSGRQAISEEEIQRMVEEVEKRLGEELKKQVSELQQYKSQVQESIRELLSGATSDLDPTEISVEGYYQVMCLLVDMYRSVVGITGITLTNGQWEELLQEMPLEGKLVIPRMLVEAKLRAENPRVCHVLLGGLLNAHTAFMINAQGWAMEAALTRPTRHELNGPALTDTQLHEYEEQSATMLQVMEESRDTTEGFLLRLGDHEAKQKPQYGYRRMKYIFRTAGWEAEGNVALGDIQIPPWAVDYTLPPPSDYVAGLIPINCPDSYEMRILQKKIDIGEYLPYEQLMTEIDRPDGAVWNRCGPSEDHQAWLDYRLEKKPGSSIFGTNVPASFCKERKAAQCQHAVPMWNRDVTSPSIYVGGVEDGPVFDSLLAADRPKLLIELRSFFMSCHRGNENEGALKDPRVLVAYSIAKGLAMLLSIDWRVGGKFERFELYKAVHGGGWSMYQCACSLGPRMVRWLSWAGRSGYLPGLHAALVEAVDGYTTYKMTVEEARDKRQVVGFIPTATGHDKHHELPQQLPMPPNEASRGSDDEPWELFWEEKEEWRRTKNAAGWDAAVARIGELRKADRQRRLSLALEMGPIDKEAQRAGRSTIERCMRHPKYDASTQDPAAPPTKLSKAQRRRKRQEQTWEIENDGPSDGDDEIVA